MNKWVANGIHVVEDVKDMVKRVLVDRKGGSTVEYVVVLAGAAALAMILWQAISDNSSTLEDKVQSVFDQLSEVGN